MGAECILNGREPCKKVATSTKAIKYHKNGIQCLTKDVATIYKF